MDENWLSDEEYEKLHGHKRIKLSDIEIVCPEIVETKFKLEEGEFENYFKDIEPLSIEVELKVDDETRKGLDELFRRARIELARKAFGSKVWTSYHTFVAQKWARVDRIGGEEMAKDFAKLPATTRFIITEPREIVKGSKISAFSFVARNAVDEDWYFTSWFILPKRVARKTAKAFYRLRRKQNLEGYLKLLRKFKPVEATEDMMVGFNREEQ